MHCGCICGLRAAQCTPMGLWLCCALCTARTADATRQLELGIKIPTLAWSNIHESPWIPPRS